MAHEIPLIVDEVFLDYALAGVLPQSFAGWNKTLCFTLSGISKILRLPQMKISWIIVSGPKDLKNQAIEKLEIISDTYLSASAPAQNALPQWLESTEKIQKEILQRLQTNLGTARTELAKTPSKFITPEGGWYGLLEMPGTRTDEEWAMRLLEKTQVLAHPGYLFDFEQEKYLVLSLLAPPEIFKAGAEKIRSM